ncbi:MAG: HdeD family acid-resistance protein [Christensenellales bacterium]|jgi:uncharacterized membrane protein HdeD (DUF308 family)
MLQRLKWTSVLLAIVCMVCGLVLIFNPATTARAVVRLFGWIALVSGIIHIVDYFSHGEHPLIKRQGLIHGLLKCVAALLLLGLTNVIISLLSLVVGLSALVAGVFAIQTALDSRALGHPYWWVSLIAATLGILLGLILIFSPINALSAIITLAGIALFAYGAEQLWMIFFVFGND